MERFVTYVCVGVPVTHGATFQGFVRTGMDVTEQEQLTKALRKSEEELRQVLGPSRLNLLRCTALTVNAFTPTASCSITSALVLEEWRQSPGPGNYVLS